MKFSEYQAAAAATDILAPTDPVWPLLGMVGEVGGLVAEYKKRERDKSGYRAFSDEVREELGDLLWYVAALARRADLDLDAIADDNLRKTRELFLRPTTPPAHELFDDGSPASEQLPRSLTVSFTETVEESPSGKAILRVRMFQGTEPIGDPLDDNSVDDDAYRYHDVFHLAHLAVLGWSPVLRSLLGRKRRSDPDADRIEDGGRATAIEEGLTAFVFSAASPHSYFAHATEVPQSVLKACQAMTAHLEVARRTRIDWSYAILTGYRVFREVTSHRGGVVHADLQTRTLDYVPPLDGVTSDDR